jgi:hypothetical protein
MQNTILVFVMGSGRSGTKMISQLLAGVEHIEAHHEYVRDFYQRDAALYFMGRLDRQHMLDKLREVYASAAYYSEAKYFIDSSNKLAWVADLLPIAFPNARFVQLVRDGRKVASSFFHKLRWHVYADKYTSILQDWLNDSMSRPMPPPNEEFWWIIPQEGQPFHQEFDSFDRFQRCCYQWAEANRVIHAALSSVPETHQRTVRLEDLMSSQIHLANLLAFLEIEYDDSFMQVMKKPRHVYVPIDYPLTDRQRIQFSEIGSQMMALFGYDLSCEEYRVQY